MATEAPRIPLAERLEFDRALREDYLHVDFDRMSMDGDGLFLLMGEATAEGYREPPTWAEAARLLDESGWLRGLLRDYGGHTILCALRCAGGKSAPCSCGWDEVERELREEATR